VSRCLGLRADWGGGGLVPCGQKANLDTHNEPSGVRLQETGRFGENEIAASELAPLVALWCRGYRPLARTKCVACGPVLKIAST